MPCAGCIKRREAIRKQLLKMGKAVGLTKRDGPGDAPRGAGAAGTGEGADTLRNATGGRGAVTKAKPKPQWGRGGQRLP